ncbi:Retrovirus-related Pol polyprotein from transposon TNT 1-94 [Euphorbia peplus]|nr:Retrovirus-related Pol polyprotein from transposon TNT 1-94 [Euphorbia peplus]
MSKFDLRSILTDNKLVGSNFTDWFRSLKIVLRAEKIEYVLDSDIPDVPAEGSEYAVEEAYLAHKRDSDMASCVMLASMSPELQKQHDNMDARSIIVRLKELFEKQKRSERYEISEKLFRSKMTEGTSVTEHVVKTMGCIKKLADLGFNMDVELSVDLVLQSLPKSYSPFVINFKMNNLEVNLAELLNMLKTFEPNVGIKQEVSAMVVDRANKRKWKGPKKGSNKKAKGSDESHLDKGKQVKVHKPKGECHHCGKEGHWRRNCKVYLESLKKKKLGEASTSGIFHIEIHSVQNFNNWVLDTGCGSHICNNVHGLKGIRNLKKGEVGLRVGNGSRVAAVAVGDYFLTLSSGLVLGLTNCLFVPAMSSNIISIGCLDNVGFDISIKNKSCNVSLNGIHYFSGSVMNGIYILNNEITSLNVTTKKPRLDNEIDKTYLWHCRLGHINEQRLSKLHSDGLLDTFDFESLEACESCLKGKMAKTPFNSKGERSTEILGLVHTDVCGPMSTPARGGFNYFISFIDDLSRYGYIYLMKHKSESFERFKEYRMEVEKQTGKQIKILRSDRGGEYLSGEFLNYLKENGIVSQWTPPYTPQHNGVSERRNRTLLDMVRSMMGFATLPKSFWGYALETALFILNRVPTKSATSTPYELFIGGKPKLSFMKVWGCLAYVKHIVSDKLDPKSDKCFFIGYPKETKGYYFYHPDDRKVIVSRHAGFLEKEFLEKKDTNSVIELEEVRTSSEEETEQVAETVGAQPEYQSQEQVTLEPRRSIRVRQGPERYGYLVDEGEETLVVDNDEPRNYKEAINSPDSAKWKQAMQSEMDSMYENKVWTLVDSSEDMRYVGCRWIFKKKRDMDGKVVTYKARLVAKGYTQKQGIDYEETFSPVAMIKSIRIMLAIAAHYDYEIWQMDVKTACLNGHLEEDVYMMQPEGFTSKDTKQVCKLQRSIYGLKQASRSWNKRFDEAVKGYGFEQNYDEPCVYKKNSGSTVVFLILYVDDILLMGNDVPALQQVKVWLSSVFSMKDLGEASYILGIMIYRDRPNRMIGLSQSTYLDKVLRRFSMENSKRGNLPMVVCKREHQLSKKMCPVTEEDRMKMAGKPYANAIGSIMYVMLCTRPDVAFALSMTSRFQANPGERHWTAVKNILKYLRRTKEMFLVYGGGELRVEGYTDASYETDVDDFKSQSGFVFIVNGGAVSWKSSKQTVTATSTTESEYIAAWEAAREAVWIKKFVGELGVVPDIVNPITLYCDSNGAIAQAKDPQSHQSSKHYEKRFHMLRESVAKGDIKMERVPTEDNISDPLTKALVQAVHDRHMNNYGIMFKNNWS